MGGKKATLDGRTNRLPKKESAPQSLLGTKVRTPKKDRPFAGKRPVGKARCTSEVSEKRRSRMRATNKERGEIILDV